MKKIGHVASTTQPCPNFADTDTTGGLDYSEFVTTAVVFGMFSKKDMIKCEFFSISFLRPSHGKTISFVQFASRYLILTKVDTLTRYVIPFILAPFSVRASDDDKSWFTCVCFSYKQQNAWPIHIHCRKNWKISCACCTLLVLWWILKKRSISMTKIRSLLYA